MYILKLICLAIVQLVKQVCLIPQTLATALKDRRRQAAQDQTEAERLDRIRHPSKYAGK